MAAGGIATRARGTPGGTTTLLLELELALVPRKATYVLESGETSSLVLCQMPVFPIDASSDLGRSNFRPGFLKSQFLRCLI